MSKGLRAGVEERFHTGPLGQAQTAEERTREGQRMNSGDKDGQYSMSVNLLIFIRSHEVAFLRLKQRSEAA
ncbi:hypothetical protein [Azotobacter chroococcum]|uniref:hypothetical protein n=1 Tax=Azotobacter chroococcum TaxID=353 RepID=UPI001E61C8FE|nr:hypothetical protein [Azotobacter chroococcum]